RAGDARLPRRRLEAAARGGQREAALERLFFEAFGRRELPRRGRQRRLVEDPLRVVARQPEGALHGLAGDEGIELELRDEDPRLLEGGVFRREGQLADVARLEEGARGVPRGGAGVEALHR